MITERDWLFAVLVTVAGILLALLVSAMEVGS